MIKSETVKIKINNKNKKHYINCGYSIIHGEKTEIKIKDLTKGSKVKIIAICDICGKEKEISYAEYIKNISKYDIFSCGNKCGWVKNKMTNIEKYGKDSFSKTKTYIENVKKTNQEKYGVNYYTQSEEYNQKMQNYYNEHDYNLDSEKRIKTNNEKYNTDYYQQSDEYLKNKNNIIEKYKSTITKKLLNKYDNLIHTDNKQYIFKCQKGHEYEIDRTLLKNRIISNTIICTICNPIDKQISGKENKLLEFIKENYNGEIIESDRKILGGKELDIYLPVLNLAFEFNGLYWHSELYKEKNYHLDKTESCLEKGIQLVHVWEDDWNNKQEIINSMILNKLNLSKEKIFARKCEIKDVTDNNLIRDFLNDNHIQGFVGSKVKIGLFYDNELISLMTFGKLRKPLNSKSKNNNEYEMLRFCNKLNTNIIGGASKLFKYFINKYDPEQVISYADRSYSNGNLYNILGFKFDHITSPNYYYIIDKIRKHRFGFRKDILIKQGYDTNKSEHDIMLEREYYRIYNSGNYKFLYEPSKKTQKSLPDRVQ